MFDTLGERVTADPVLERRSRFLDIAFGLAIGGEERVIRVENGRTTVAPAGSASTAFSIAIDGTAWNEFVGPMPKPGHHHLSALVENGHATVKGDLLPYFTNLYFILGVVEHARRPAA